MNNVMEKDMQMRLKFLDAAEYTATRLAKVAKLDNDENDFDIKQGIFALLSCLSAAEEAYPEIFKETFELYETWSEGAGLK